MLRRGGTTEICVFRGPASSKHNISRGEGGGGGGGFTGKKSESTRSQLRPLATHTPSWGASVKAPGCKVCHKLGSGIFLVNLAFLDISSKKMCL